MTSYTPAIDALLAADRLNPLGPGTPNEAVHGQLAALTSATVFAPHAVRDRTMANCCLAALWLHHDCLDESHGLSQEIDTPEGSYWHALMHRREPDFSNAKYWFRRVGRHPIFVDLRDQAAALAAQASGAAQAAFLARQTEWDPYAFVDLCESAYRGRAPNEELCRQIQRCEWKLLFAYCYRCAVEG